MASNFPKKRGKSNRGLTKKGLRELGLVRITNKEGKRVWRVGAAEMSTLREVVIRFRLAQLGMNI